MKKLLIPSVLAGLMICIPTISAHAAGYEPYTWDTIGEQSSGSWTDPDGSVWSTPRQIAPGPAGLFTQGSINGSAPSGVAANSNNEYYGLSNSVWAWTAGGAPSDYEDVSTVQGSMAFTLSSPSDGSGSSWYGFVDTDANYASRGGQYFSVTASNVYGDQDVQNVNASGLAYLTTQAYGTATINLSVNGSSGLGTALTTSTATYIIP